eukprot:3247279-Prorocentrum_lima.AAC.1
MALIARGGGKCEYDGWRVVLNASAVAWHVGVSGLDGGNPPDVRPVITEPVSSPCSRNFAATTEEMSCSS